jgi:1-deoxy-D-xylulose-5-phosphate reductoisomerase
VTDVPGTYASWDAARPSLAADSAVRRVAILGVTGSIGLQALDVIAGEPSLEVVAISAGRSWERVGELAREHAAAHVHLADAASRERLAASGIAAAVHDELGRMLDACRPDIVLNAVVGAAGLDATEATLTRGIDLALANKESLVAGGQLVTHLAELTNAAIVPVDSEHSALAQCWAGSRREEVDALVLTASGGPFFGRTREQLAEVTIEQALDHPTWSMGGKITIDSATLMNKGLELIEACVLFDVPPSQVEVVVHRHSIVHALVRHVDGSLLAHLGWPDMRVPIAWALTHPRRIELPTKRLDLVDMPALEFARPDEAAFRALALARAAIEQGGAAPCVLNAANEVAVEAFLAGRLPFTGIDELVERVLEELATTDAPDALDDVRAVDARTRAVARRALAALAVPQPAQRSGAAPR